MVLAVADGVGGHGDGQTARAKALESAVRYLFDRAPACGAVDATMRHEAQLTVVLEAAFRHAQDEEQGARRSDSGEDELAEEHYSGVLERFEHVLSHAVGGGEGTSLDVELRRCGLQSGDHLLLCSDGLTAHVDDDDIARCLGDDALDASDCVEVLVRAANAGGGSDNVTAVVASVR